MNKADISQLNSHLQEMKNSRIANYAIAGLDSYLIGGGNFGKVRYFECDRNHQDTITPHGHRFDSMCLVLSGKVVNREWKKTTEDCGDLFAVSKLTYQGRVGHHEVEHDTYDHFYFVDHVYHEGDMYMMYYDHIHSISFSRDTKVLFFEGPEITKETVIIEPVVNGEIICTYKNEDWMFLEDEIE